MNISKKETDRGTWFNIDTIKDRELLESKGINVDVLEQKETLRLEALEQIEHQKMNADYNGVNLSLSSKDALGLLQVQSAFALGVPETNFQFENGTKLLVKADEFVALSTWFAVERNKLFMG